MFTDAQEKHFQQISEVQSILGKNKTPWDFDGIDRLLYFGSYQTIEKVLAAKEIWCRYESIGDGCCGFYHQVELGNKKPANNFISDVYVFLVKTLQERFSEHLKRNKLAQEADEESQVKLDNLKATRYQLGFSD